jgi:hypothetical protein
MSSGSDFKSATAKQARAYCSPMKCPHREIQAGFLERKFLLKGLL